MAGEDEGPRRERIQLWHITVYVVVLGMLGSESRVVILKGGTRN
jgi:hypothetical protein